MVDDKEESEIKIELIDDEDQHPNEIPPIKNSPNARAGSNMCRRSRISAIFSSSGEDPSYYEIQRGSISLQRNRQVFFVLSGIQLVLRTNFLRTIMPEAQRTNAQICYVRRKSFFVCYIVLYLIIFHRASWLCTKFIRLAGDNLTQY